MSEYPREMYVRVVNPGTVDEYSITGTEASDVDATHLSDSDSVDPMIARYVLAGAGSIHMMAPVYVEDITF